MAGIRRMFLCAIALFLLSSTATAFGGRFFRPMNTTYYFECIPTGPTVMPVPDARPGNARPTPAPPSGTPEPPLGKKQTTGDLPKPLIVASHSANPDKAPALDRARVGFWNLSGHDVTLVIAGKSWPLAKNAAVTLSLERQFSWQLAGQSGQHVERLPDNVSAHEVLIRE